jgi:hypothetical protein
MAKKKNCSVFNSKKQKTTRIVEIPCKINRESDFNFLQIRNRYPISDSV